MSDGKWIAKFERTDADRASSDDIGLQPETPSAKFWVVWNPSHHLPPSVKFPTKDLATAAAMRMARKFRTDVFFVMCVAGVARAEQTPVAYSVIK